ncbi:EAL domain-containing protein [Billgrantia sp. Q4P2]|uniref:EAL domain-containing protein n=1 Tax=Billgrantia sp. Q4P2 TaxID=3463857 RepID=UPI004057A78E
MRLSGLRYKVLIVVAVGLLLLFAVQFVVGRLVLLEGYSQLEQDKMLTKVGSAVSLLEEQSRQLGSITVDWAHWDDSYQYMAAPNQEYIDSNYTDDTFDNLNISAILLVDANGNILFKKGVVAGQPWPIPLKLEQAALKGGALIDTTGGRNHVSGFFWTPEGIFIVAAFDVRPSGNAEGERRGRLIMVRQLDQTLLDHVSQLLGIDIIVERADVQGLAADRLDALTHMQVEGGMAVKPLNDTDMIGYALMDDVGDTTPLLLRATDDRRIFEQGQSSLNFLIGSTALIVLVLGVFHWLFDRLVLVRLAHLSKHVNRIGESADTAVRIPTLRGNDELAGLSHGINGMLERLDESQLALHYEKERAQITLAGIADAVITSDAAGDIIYLNAAAERLTGISAEEASGQSLQSLFRLLSVENKTVPVNSIWLTEPATKLEEVILQRSDGEELFIRKSAAPLHDYNGDCFGFVTVLHDVTMLRALSRQLSFQARHDALTGLINRYEFDRLAQAALEDAVQGERTHCIAYIDLDQFKIVNDTCGHMAGDTMLCQLAGQLKARVRSSDTLARLGGDEFALLLMGCSLERAREVIENLLQIVREFRFVFEDKVFRVGASVGLTELSPAHTYTLSELLSTVDSACYAAKDEGGNRIHVYRPNDQDLQQRYSQLEWVSRIHEGLEKEQFVLYFQRMQGLTEGVEPHCEVLIRMRGEDGTLYPPGYFLPVAERYHLMPQLDRWVVREAFSIMARKGADFPYVCAINLSGQTLSEEGFLDYVIELIEHYGLDPRRFCFEITETSVIANLDKARQFMRMLRELGCSFSLDDFGSGLSSFAYLRNLDVDFLKIDGMFVKAIDNNPIDRVMVASISQVGHVMGLRTIAEFAENEGIIDILREIGVDYAQGYGVAKPELFQ